MTFPPSAEPEPPRTPRGLPPDVAVTAGGGGTTLFGRGLPVPLLPRASLVLTAGGGGTTCETPNTLPIKLLRNDPLPDCVGGGGTTDFEGSGTLPLASRRMSRDTSLEGGGAITDGAGMASFGSRVPARSGADTGGGTTATFDICTGPLEISRLTPPGAGGITLAAMFGAERTPL